MAARKGTSRALSDRHERYLAALIDGRIMPGSGNQAANPMDVRNDARQGWAFAVDGKATMAASASVSLAMWHKAVEQAGMLEPALALRFYHDTRLVSATDLIVIEARQFGYMLEELRGTNGV